MGGLIVTIFVPHPLGTRIHMASTTSLRIPLPF
jgi:hypothetical protein